MHQYMREILHYAIKDLDSVYAHNYVESDRYHHCKFYAILTNSFTINRPHQGRLHQNMSGFQVRKPIDNPSLSLKEKQSTISDDYSSFENMEDCNEAFEIARRWLETWRQTGNARHLETAIACQRIAKERFASFKAESSFRDEYDIQMTRIMEQIERSLVAAQRLLDGGELPSGGDAGYRITKLMTRR